MPFTGLKTSGETETGGEGAVRADDSSAENPKETKIKSSSNRLMLHASKTYWSQTEGRKEGKGGVSERKREERQRRKKEEKTERSGEKRARCVRRRVTVENRRKDTVR